MRTCLCNTRASSYPDDDGLARNGTEILLNRSRSVHFCSANGQILGVEWQNDESSSSRIRVSAAACGPAMWLRATLPGLTGQTDPHGQLTADEMGILPSTYGVPFTGGSSLRGHAIGGERYVAPFGGGGPGAASAAVATEGGAAWLEAGNTAFRARRRRRRRTTRVAAGAIHGCPVRVRAFYLPIQSNPLVAARRVGGRRVSSSDPSGPP